MKYFCFMRETFKTYYNYLYQEMSGYKFYEIKETKANRLQIDRFLDYIESVGEDKLWDFLCYQFFRYSNKKTRFGKNIVQLGWIIGKKAMKEWSIKTPERWFYCVEWKMENELSNPIADNRYRPSSKFLNSLRLRYFEEERGFILCSSADLYDMNSHVCKICKFKEYCEKQSNE